MRDCFPRISQPEQGQRCDQKHLPNGGKTENQIGDTTADYGSFDEIYYAHTTCVPARAANRTSATRLGLSPDSCLSAVSIITARLMPRKIGFLGAKIFPKIEISEACVLI